MNRAFCLTVALLSAGCSANESTIDDALARMKAEIKDGTQVEVNRSTVSLHYREGWQAVCGEARVSNPNPIFKIHGGQEHFIVFVHDSGAVVFSFDGRQDPEGREEFKRLWNANCVG